MAARVGVKMSGSFTATVTHGGTDAGPAIRWDFSTNGNAVPLPPALHDLLLQADRTLYPDPAYTALRHRLAEGSHCAVDRIVPTAGNSEGIRRMTLAAMQRGVREVWVPVHAYADYAAAATALGMAVQRFDPQASQDWLAAAARSQREPVLVWLCEPCNPTGTCLRGSFWSAFAAMAQMHAQLILAVDRAYAPVHLPGPEAPVDRIVAEHAWQLWSPNKALGLTGVRAGWMQAPARDALLVRPVLEALAPSWVLSAEGVQMLMHWHDAPVQQWLASSRRTLADWLAQQQGGLIEAGWSVHATCVPFFLAAPPADWDVSQGLLARLRECGIKLRDAASFGLPGLVRMRVHDPQAQAALLQALDEINPNKDKGPR
ncbi:MAG: aminotransferase class I/II-fold pyridoxal phosphate-dependent enzyme [Aquabacterium sp.]